MKLLTFLGTSPYKLCEYKFNNQTSQENKFIQTTLVEILNPSEIFVFVTDEAKRKNYKELLMELKQNKYAPEKVFPVSIPDGKTEEELWQIFEIISQNIKDDDNICVDITHSFRSLPLITFMVITFLRQVKKINIKGLLYGAFEAKDENNIAPIFDLTPFLSLHEWLIASDRFLHSGEAKEINFLLSTIQNQFYKNSVDSVDTEKPTKLKSLGSKLNELQKSIHLVRVKESIENSGKTLQIISEAKQEVVQYVKPIVSLLETIKDRIEPISSANAFSKEGLQAQINLIELYIETNHPMEAITLIREWLVTFACLKDKREPLIKENREAVEKDLNSTYNDIAELEKNKNFTISGELTLLYKFWGRVRDIRNDLDHAGMRENPSPANSIFSQIPKLIKKLKEIIRESNLLDLIE